MWRTPWALPTARCVSDHVIFIARTSWCSLGSVSLAEANLFEGVGSENPFRELVQPVERGDCLDLLPNLLRKGPKLLGKLKEKELASSRESLRLRPRHLHRSDLLVLSLGAKGLELRDLPLLQF